MKRSLTLLATVFVSMAMATQTAERPKQLDALDYFTGKWVTESTSTPGDTSTFTGDWVLGKRHLRMQQAGKMMGMQMEGLMMLTWDETKNKYSSTWFDSMGGMVMTGYGDWKGDVLTTTTEAVEMEGQKMKIRVLMTKKGTGKFEMDVAGGDGDKWQSFLNMTYVKAK